MHYIHCCHLLQLRPEADLHCHHMEGRSWLNRPEWLFTHRDGLPARRQSPIQVLSGTSIEYTPMHYCIPLPLCPQKSAPENSLQ